MPLITTFFLASRDKYSSRTNRPRPAPLTSEIFPCFVLPSIMYYERKFEFQIAARKRASGDQTPSVCSLAAKQLPQGSAFFVTRTDLTPSDRGDGAAFTPNTSRAASHGFLIVTPRLEFPAKLTRQSPDRISNRYKIAVFSSELPVHARNRQEASPPEFPWAPWRLIANLRLKFLSSASKSIKYKFLIANRSHFLWRKRTSSGSDSASPQRTGTETRCVSLAPIPYSRPLLPDFGAAARLSWQELNCGSCHTFHRRLDHVWTLKMGHDQA